MNELVRRVHEAANRFVAHYGVSPEEVWLGPAERKQLSDMMEQLLSPGMGFRFVQPRGLAAVNSICGLPIRESEKDGLWVGVTEEGNAL